MEEYDNDKRRPLSVEGMLRSLPNPEALLKAYAEGQALGGSMQAQEGLVNGSIRGAQPRTDVCVDLGTGPVRRQMRVPPPPWAQPAAMQQQKPDSDVDRAMKTASHAQDCLANAVLSLERRLAPVLNEVPEGHKPQERVGSVPRAPLAMEIEALCGRTLDAHERLQRMLERLAL